MPAVSFPLGSVRVLGRLVGRSVAMNEIVAVPTVAAGVPRGRFGMMERGPILVGPLDPTSSPLTVNCAVRLAVAADCRSVVVKESRPRKTVPFLRLGLPHGPNTDQRPDVVGDRYTRFLLVAAVRTFWGFGTWMFSQISACWPARPSAATKKL